MSLLIWIARLIVLVLIVRFVVAMIRQATISTRGRGPSPVRPKGPTERLGGTLVQDPRCGTYLPKDRALVATSGGATHYFCSATCRDEWMRDGQKAKGPDG